MNATTHERRRAGDLMEPAISLVSLGITVNDISVGLIGNSGREPGRRGFGVDDLTLTSFFVGALSIIWIFLR